MFLILIIHSCVLYSAESEIDINFFFLTSHKALLLIVNFTEKEKRAKISYYKIDVIFVFNFR